jgi:phosphatidylinositol alpha-mannosyltransferase
LLSRQILTRSSAKNVATFHAKLPETVMSRTIERVITPYTKSILKYLDSFTAVSTAAADYASDLTDRRITIVPNGIDIAKYKRPSGVKSSAPNVLYVGRLEKRKGLVYLVRAMKTLQASQPDVELRIAGTGPDHEQLARLAKELGVNVTFYGWVTEADKLRLLHEATVFCSPARYGESFGIVLLEAMAAGIPTVAGDNPGYVAVMQETGALSIVSPKDTADFARRLELFVTDKGLRKHWVDWAQVYVQQFSYKNVVDQYERIYKSVF